MDFSYTEEQQMLQDSIAKFVLNDYDFDTRMKLVKSEPGYGQDNWRLFAELGWLMVPFTEADGGLGGSATDLMVVMEEFGKGIVVEPFVATAVLAGGLVAAAGNDSQKAEWLSRIMAGDVQMAFACAEPGSRYNLAHVSVSAIKEGDHYVLSGHKAVVLNGGAAEVIVVSARTSGAQTDADGISLLLLDANSDGARINSYRTQDGGRAAEVHLDRVKVPVDRLLGVEGQALPVINHAINRATLAVCAEAVGAMEVILRKTVEYSKTRVQFGVPIGSFQALQHRMADMFIEHQQAKSIVLMAAMQLDQGGTAADKAVSAMKSRIGKAGRKIGQEAIQIHGGIGVTDELDVGHYFKRLTMIELLFGNGDFHTQRFAALG